MPNKRALVSFVILPLLALVLVGCKADVLSDDPLYNDLTSIMKEQERLFELTDKRQWYLGINVSDIVCPFVGRDRLDVMVNRPELVEVASKSVTEDVLRTTHWSLVRGVGFLQDSVLTMMMDANGTCIVRWKWRANVP